MRKSKKAQLGSALAGVLLAVCLAAITTVGVRAALLTFVEAHFDGVGGVDGLNEPYYLTVSPDGDYVYVTGFSDDALAVFSREQSTGSLSFVEVYLDGVNGVDGLNGAYRPTVSADGKHIYVASGDDNAVAVFYRDSASGKLIFVEAEVDGVDGVDGLQGAFMAKISPDGQHVYVSGQHDNSVALFLRDTDTGHLSFVEFYRDGVGGVDGINRPLGVAISHDGRHVYVSGYDDHALAVFSRNSSTGQLTFVTFYQDDIVGGAADGLWSANDLVISQDGKHLYITAQDDSSVAVFSRDSNTGELTFVDVYKDGDPGISFLAGAFGVAIDPSGDYVFATGSSDDSLSVFSRDSDNGELSFVEAHRNGVDGVSGLNEAWGIAVSPKGDNVYVVGRTGDSVAAFAAPATDSVDEEIAASSKPGQQLTFGINNYYDGRLYVIVPASSIPSGYTDCRIQSEVVGNSSAHGFSLDDSVWEVQIVCNGEQVSTLAGPITLCIRPADGVPGNKHIYHRHSGSSAFSPLPDVAAAGGYVCGTTTQLSLFTLGVDSLPATGFAPGVVTELAGQPQPFAQTELMLSIPQIGVNASIVGVPKADGAWDVSWLDQSAGYLEDTAFPTLPGNTVITAHVWDADGSAGLFARLDELEYGDRFSIRSGGQTYTYEVRGNQLYSPASSEPLQHEDYDWVTLITCESFDEASGQYRYRRAVRAVLVSID